MSVPRRQTPVPSRTWAPGSPLAVRVFVAVLSGWGAAQSVLWGFNMGEMRDVLLLDDIGLRAGEYWRLLTYQLFHANPAHFLVTLLVFYLAGREVEPIIGRRPFVALCLGAGLLGGLVNLAVAAPHAQFFGFSAAAAAVLAVYSTILPEFEHRVPLFHIVTVRFRAKFLALLPVIFAAICLVLPALGETGPAGMLAGAMLGWVWARQLGFGNQHWLQRKRLERRERLLRRQRMSADEFIRMEIDPILEKISREGLQGLTRAERRILEEGRDKIAAESVAKK